MFVRARIEVDRHDGATVVPYSALARRNGQQGVFLVDRQEMKARFVPVETGIDNAELVEIVRPPLEGLVATLGHHLLEDGSAVILPTSARGTAAGEGTSPDLPAGGPPGMGGRP